MRNRLFVLLGCLLLVVLCTTCHETNSPSQRKGEDAVSLQITDIGRTYVVCEVKVQSKQTPFFVGVHCSSNQGKDAKEVYLEDGASTIIVTGLTENVEYEMYAFADIAGHDEFVMSASEKVSPGNVISIKVGNVQSTQFTATLRVATTKQVYMRGVTFKQKSAKGNPTTYYLEEGCDSIVFTGLTTNTSYVVQAFADIEGYDAFVYSDQAEAFTNSVIIDGDYKLVFSDEFNGTGAPDTGKWNFEEGYKRNNEDQYYTKDVRNAFMEDGYLHIVARNDINVSAKQTKKYTSASITTSRSFVYCYGRVECRAKIPTGSGMWPAIWQVGNEYDWPSNGELDIFEYYNERIHANAAWGSAKAWTAVWKSVARPISYYTMQDPNWRDEFHIWRCDWDEDYIRIYIDDELINEIDVSKTVNEGCHGNTENPYRYHKNGWGHYLWLNLAIGGNNGGRIDDSLFPATFLIDYIRVYQKTRLPN